MSAIYLQIAEQIREQVIKGLLKPGDALPSIRKMAIMQGVNANTVAKAYGELERQEIIETISGKGAYIAHTTQKQLSEKQLKELKKTLKTCCMTMHYMGMTKEEMIKEFETIYDELIEKGE